MNFYPFHIGDFFIATAHLSWDESHAYRLLLDLYYKQEAPLPADIAQIARLLRISNKSHLRAIESVLREFFTLTEAGWVNNRCEAEIAKAEERREAASAKANARWHKDGHRTVRRGHVAGKAHDESGDAPIRQAPTQGDASSGPSGGNGVAMQQQCPSNAPRMQKQCRGNAVRMPQQCSSNAAALPGQCTGNAPNTNTNPIPNPTPIPPSSAAGKAHDHAPARSGAASRPGAADARGGDEEGDEGGKRGARTDPPEPLPAAGAGMAPHGATAAGAAAIPDPPASMADWHNFFIRAGFAPGQLLRQNTRAAMLDWVRKGITQSHMRAVIERARARRDGPTSPAYLVPMIERDLAEAAPHRAPPFARSPGAAAVAAIAPGGDALAARERRPSIEPI
jgi:uncharacterized protein YdaU (DUF1376 family)